MRQVLTGLAVGALACSAVPASAQQGSVQVSAAAQAITGDPDRIAGQNRLEPDFGLTWLQPGSRWGVFQLEARGARRQDRLHPGKLFLAVRDLKYRGFAWTIQAGDTYFSPTIGEYKFSNIFTPAVTFNGGSVSGRTKDTTVEVVAGKTSAWRNIFGSDPQTLEQHLTIARVTRRIGARLEVSGRASRVRTKNLKEFSYSIAASDQAGGGARTWLTPSIQIVADASVVSYKRVGTNLRERDASAMIGGSWLHRRGWVQVNASRFSPGDFPSLNSPLPDREGVFIAGDYDVARRLRVFAGWDAFRTNLNPATSRLSSRPLPEGSGYRQFGGLRVQLWTRSTVTLRAEQGARVSRPLAFGLGSDSDTGSWAAEWQAAAGSLTTFVRYARRDNVDRINGSSSLRQHDFSGQLFANVSGSMQLFASALATKTRLADESGSTYWQMGGGGQVQLPRRNLWVRAEGHVARNVDLLTQSFVPRESLSLGINGQMTGNMSVALNVNVDRSPMAFATGSPWTTRSTLRVTRMLPTGTAYVTNSAALTEATSGRGTGSVTGSVFADWNGNGERDAEDSTLEGIPVRIGASNLATTGRDGQFAFLNVPVGTRAVGLDTGSLPIDFDPPETAQVDVEIERGDAKHVSFGLRPLGTIEGQVTRDANGNGRADPGEEAIDGAIVVLDGGARSEQARGGRFRFDAVRSGEHLVKLLLESLPEGAVIKGEAEVRAALGREQMSALVPFLVAVEKRPEIRKVFPPRGGGTAGRAPAASAGRSTPVPPRAVPTRPSTRPAATSAAVTRPAPARFAVQIAALSERANVAGLLLDLKSAGLAAYVVSPATDGGLYRVRVGPYRTRVAADRAAAALETQFGTKFWVVKEK